MTKEDSLKVVETDSNTVIEEREPGDSDGTPQNNALKDMVTKVPMGGSKVAVSQGRLDDEEFKEDSEEEESEMHRIHMLQSLQALSYMKTVEKP